ncbi:MAG TPA: zinc metalloprotease HtpX [Thermomicrobiaceae bacterium]|nr:zinc metalloprotease HtpX [Thermomicrobiaceae bacterium]
MVKWGRDTQLSVRMFLVMFLLAVVYLAFIAILASAGVSLIFLVVVAILLLAVQYFFSDKIALLSMGAHEVTEQEAPQLHETIGRLAQIADLPKPRVALARTSMPNAFATGRNPKNAVIAVTTGLMERLEPRELEAVLAHEMTHIRNRDVVVMTVASFFAMVAQLLMRMMFWGSLFGGGFGGGGRRDRNEEGMMAFIYLASILVWIISFFLIRTLSRYREYAADRGSAIITGSPSSLMSALTKISGVMDRIPDKDLRQVQGMNALFISPATKQTVSELFSTHPTLEHRLARLREMSREMEGM